VTPYNKHGNDQLENMKWDDNITVHYKITICSHQHFSEHIIKSHRYMDEVLHKLTAANIISRAEYCCNFAFVVFEDLV
jgi:hypothetical protein